MATLAADDSPAAFSSPERAAILAMLEEFTDALAIYHNTLKKPTKHDNDIPVDDTSCLDASSSREIEDAKERAASVKVYENSLYIRRIMEELKEEIRDRGTFEVVTREIETILAGEKEEEALLTEQKRLGEAAAELQRIIEEESLANEKERRRLLMELAEEQRSVEKLKLIADAEVKYVGEWERARYEQISLRCDMEIKKFEKILNDCRVRERNEERVHDALANFLIQETTTLEGTRKEWEERYAREKEVYEKEIRQLRIEIEARRKELDDLKEEYHRNQEFIDAYLKEKETVRMAKEVQERMEKSAIKIEAWWRGVMVRRKLGPYRPVEKKKKRQSKTKK
ncbi:IQ domain-containing protein G [Habropoda laboriosa]|uniref:IQ domain-containing protein G n=1 Tax=Habropoda laboriosa TaxID=597456 RepID=A0A0L7QR11_9HYME|nr:PREDICTED: IQ domain-containing protein G [Habropoda laboriosa]KOC60931.1 IQ domain-containing protein G [Habropoda laboriosa]